MSGPGSGDVESSGAKEPKKAKPESQAKISNQSALNYLDQVKAQFNDQPEVYARFLEIMKEFKANIITTDKVIESVTQLFSRYPHLIEGFNAFLPHDQRIKVPKVEEKPVFQNYGYLVPGPARYGVSPGISPYPNAVTSWTEPSTGYTPSNTFGTPSLVHAPSRESLGSGGFPKQSEIVGSRKASVGMVQAFSYLKKIRERFEHQPEIYQAFVEILKAYKRDEASIKDVYLRVRELFGDNRDLLEEFSRFVPASYGPGTAGDKTNGKKDRETEKMPEKPSDETELSEAEFFNHVKAHLNNNEQLYGDFLKALNWYTQDIVKREELVRLVRKFIGESDELFSWFKRFVGHKEQSSRDVVDKYTLDLSMCKRFGSYRFLPENYEASRCSGRTLLGAEVLNNVLVSCPSFSSEDSTFESSRKNVYEEALFRCEDERYELDMLVEGNQLALVNFRAVLRKVGDMTAQSKEYTLDECLPGTSTTLYKKALRKVYGNRWEQVMEGIQKSPQKALPVVISRLEQKDNEWRSVQREWNHIWRQVHQKNYYKALDHQGLGSKTLDKKNTSLKTLLNEILPVYDNVNDMWRETRMRLSVPDTEIIGDVLRLLIYLNIRHYSGAERVSVVQFLINFVAGFFSIGVESLEDFEDENAWRDMKFVTRSEMPRTVFYGDESYYVFFRLFQIVCHRLGRLQSVGKEYQQTPLSHQRQNYIASQLDPYHAEIGNLMDNSSYYRLLVGMLVSLMDGKLDQATFEEHGRLLFGPFAYLMFTLDRTLFLCVKQVLGILGDASCQNLMALYDSCQRSQRTPELLYRLAVKSLVQDSEEDSMFYIAFYRDSTGGLLEFGTMEASKKAWEELQGKCMQQFVDIHQNPDAFASDTDLVKMASAKKWSEYNQQCGTCRRLFGLSVADQGPGKYPTDCIGPFAAWIESCVNEFH